MLVPGKEKGKRTKENEKPESILIVYPVNGLTTMLFSPAMVLNWKLLVNENYSGIGLAGRC